MKKLYCLISMIGLLMIFTAPASLGQDLAGKWFQMTFSAKGYDYLWPDLIVGDANSGKVVNYYQFVYNDIWSTACPAQFFPFYELHVWYPGFGGWEYYVSEHIGPGETCYGILCPYYTKTSSDKQFVTVGHGDWLYFQGGDFTSGWANAVTILALKRKEGAITSATLKSYGCISDSGTAAGSVGGSCTIKGKLIKPDKLPEGINPAGAGPYFTVPDSCPP